MEKPMKMDDLGFFCWETTMFQPAKMWEILGMILKPSI